MSTTREDRITMARARLWIGARNNNSARSDLRAVLAEMDRLKADNAFLRREKQLAWGKLLEDTPPVRDGFWRRLFRMLTRKRTTTNAA